MVKIPIPDSNPDKYENIAADFRAARMKIRKLNNVYIDNTDNKVLIKEIRDILIDMGKLFRTMNGVQRDDDIRD